MLKGKAGLAFTRGYLRHVLAVKQNLRLAGIVGKFQAGDGSEQRGLAGAGRAEQRDEFAGLDLEADVVERGEATEFFRDVFDFDTHAINFCVWFPAPRPSLVGRGRTVPRLKANLRLSSAGQPAAFLKTNNGFSRSPGERVRVRGGEKFNGRIKFISNSPCTFALPGVLVFHPCFQNQRDEREERQQRRHGAGAGTSASRWLQARARLLLRCGPAPA